MRQIRVSGTLPPTMTEGSRPGDWAATLNLSGDLDGLTRVEILGRDALALTASLLPGGQAVALAPAAPTDYESLVVAGRAPVLEAALRFVFSDGTVLDDPTPRSITVLDVDDTPPTALAFASGGSVAVGAIGASIGRLRVTDPDSTGPFTFSFAPEDAWRFEVVGDLLKLKDGVNLGFDDMPRRMLFIEVSDGRQSAAFALELRVTDAATDGWVEELPPGGELGGISAPVLDRVVAMRESRSISQADRLPGGERVLVLREGTEVVLPGGTERVAFLDGFQDSGPHSPGVQAASLQQALGGQAPGGAALAGLVARAESGTSWTEIAGTPGLASLPMEDAAVVTAIFRNALGRDPGAAELALHTARLGSGVSRAQLAVDVALGAAALDRQPEDGVWVPDPMGDDDAWRGAQGGLPEATPAASPGAADTVWLL